MATKLKGFSKRKPVKVTMIILFLLSVGVAIFCICRVNILKDLGSIGVEDASSIDSIDIYEVFTVPKYTDTRKNYDRVNHSVRFIDSIYIGALGAYNEAEQSGEQLDFVDFTNQFVSKLLKYNRFEDIEHAYIKFVGKGESLEPTSAKHFEIIWDQGIVEVDFEEYSSRVDTECYYEFDFEKDICYKGANTNKEVPLFRPNGSHEMADYIAGIKIYYSEETLASNQREWFSTRVLMQQLIITFIVCCLIALISFFWLVAVVGVDHNNEKIPLNPVMGFYTEIQFIVASASILLVFLAVETISVFGNYRYGSPYDEDMNIVNILAECVLFMALAAIWLYFILSIIAKIRNKQFVKRSLICIIIGALASGTVKLFKDTKGVITGESFSSKNYKYYSILQNVAVVIGCVIPCLFIIIMAFAVAVSDGGIEWLVIFALPIIILLLCVAINVYSTWIATKDFKVIEKEIEDIYTNTPSGEYELNDYSPYKEVSDKLLSISKNYQANIDERIKSERMKVDLVTNVSHDLKTPLTSIISYVDLLKKEELTPDARDYVTILEQKSERLKNIVSDVFELAKTTSGEIAIENEKLDVIKLIIQTLGDMEDKITKSGRTIKQQLPSNPVYITSDGKRLYRVIQNLVDNAIKYSLAGTRIFIVAQEVDEDVIISIKNTAAYEMMFTKEDIIERFSRGDKSRTTEGSGLGLSIAQGFTIACGGEMDIVIDGDLFKVILKFKKTE